MHHGMASDHITEFVVLFFVRQFAVQQQITDFQIVRIFRQFSNRITTIQQNTGITINIGEL